MPMLQSPPAVAPEPEPAPARLRSVWSIPLSPSPAPPQTRRPLPQHGAHSTAAIQGQGPKNKPRPVCDLCHRSFASTTTLKSHRKTIHLGTTCNWGTCQQRFNNPVKLASHLRAHQITAAVGDEPGQFLCHFPGCTRHFPNWGFNVDVFYAKE
ncbi:uncharacterized protein F4807DRAFT_472748 [Annulohypoxylon truncatum]|uniref:uncharacterized protein n=1 Tax=Annulohypoxylon truncatum TaxID=327061 RepID=UPI002008B2C8|nr:uncharacterized protein F4807DRAFT_472748 [Annulohypoxylon truncatum]KAI1211878.1 hypothetical protein F4807DRAFT_472748 [Annulohypoxylon truncatum]